MSARLENFSTKALGSSHSGLGEWLWQRLSALYISGFIVYVTLRFSIAPIDDYIEWKSWFGSGLVRVSWALFVASVLVHAWIGLRSVYLDYLHPLWLRVAALILTGTALWALAFWATQLLFGLAP